ncbi:MAG: DUF4870 domain-containing protein, partial [Flavobacteriaceae bacterium]|nr:DUF4870 domain-containing protein [Flavobacteriaceae bacterium]
PESSLFNYQTIKLINFSAIVFFIPLGNILLPLLIMKLKKEVNTITKQIVTIQILWTLISGILFLLTPFVKKWLSLSNQSILVVLFVCILVNLFIILRNAIALDKKQTLYIKPNFSLL